VNHHFAVRSSLTFVNSNGFCRYHWKLLSVNGSGVLDVLKPISLRTPVAPLPRPFDVSTLTVIIYFAVVFKTSEVHKPCVSDVFNTLAYSRHLFLCSEPSCADLTESIASELN